MGQRIVVKIQWLQINVHLWHHHTNSSENINIIRTISTMQTEPVHEWHDTIITMTSTSIFLLEIIMIFQHFHGIHINIWRHWIMWYAQCAHQTYIIVPVWCICWTWVNLFLFISYFFQFFPVFLLLLFLLWREYTEWMEGA